MALTLKEEQAIDESGDQPKKAEGTNDSNIINNIEKCPFQLWNSDDVWTFLRDFLHRKTGTFLRSYTHWSCTSKLSKAPKTTPVLTKL